MIEITGGVYVEHCIEPAWEQLFGSGGRAAAALGELSRSVCLYTYIADEDRPGLESLSATFGFTTRISAVPETVSFSYYHGLSEPRIRPPLHLIKRANPLAIDAQNVLRFGFIEGDAVVHGQQVVYDPQNAYDPRPFGENGSTAQRLAIVANVSECLSLTKTQSSVQDVGELARAVLTHEEAEVVVVKRGAFGVMVVTSSESKVIPAFRTDRVWPIGSGDVFAAIFAHFWTAENLAPFEAARLASLSTAYYCQTTSLPISADVLKTFSPAPVVIGSGKFPLNNNRVYLAGPFFTMAQRWMIEQSKRYLSEQGFSVFSPFHDVGYGSASEVVPTDVAALEKSDFVFAIVDGLDSGTLFEIGYAKALGKPVIAFVQNESQQNLKMLEGTNCEIVPDFASTIYRITWTAIES